RSSALVPLLAWQIGLLVHKSFVYAERQQFRLLKIVFTPLPNADGITNRTTSECDSPPCGQAFFCCKQRFVQQKIQLAPNGTHGVPCWGVCPFGQTR
ncbi:MAG: hypothetical protein LBR68_07105, partial [Lachnoclostridium sp.]|nr:hypothetical protein [Lachnoclostridium sp.]